MLCYETFTHVYMKMHLKITEYVNSLDFIAMDISFQIFPMQFSIFHLLKKNNIYCFARFRNKWLQPGSISLDERQRCLSKSLYFCIQI